MLRQLVRDYDGWAIATTPDGLAAYGPLPLGVRLMAWVKPNNPPGGHRLRSCWEVVIVYPPRARRAGRRGEFVNDVLVCPSPRVGFAGAKPAEWTHWVLDALGCAPCDQVVDLFPGSGAVARAIETYTPLFAGGPS